MIIIQVVVAIAVKIGEGAATQLELNITNVKNVIINFLNQSLNEYGKSTRQRNEICRRNMQPADETGNI